MAPFYNDICIRWKIAFEPNFLLALLWKKNALLWQPFRPEVLCCVLSPWPSVIRALISFSEWWLHSDLCVHFRQAALIRLHSVYDNQSPGQRGGSKVARRIDCLSHSHKPLQIEWWPYTDMVSFSFIHSPFLYHDSYITSYPICLVYISPLVRCQPW